MRRIGVKTLTTLAAVGALSAGVAAQDGPIYFLTPLGDLPGGDFDSRARGLNDVGQVGGVSENASGPRAFLWDEVGGMQTYADANLNGAFSSTTVDINNGGLISGESTVAPGGQDNTQVFYFDGVSFVEPFAGDPDIAWSRAGQVNNNGIGVGWLGTTPASGGQTEQGFAYNFATSTVTQLSGPGVSNNTVVKGINDSNVAAGHWFESGGSTARRWDAATGVSLGDIPGLAGFTYNRSSNINEAGTVIGASANDRDFLDSRNPWVWNPGDAEVTALGLLAGYSKMGANDLTDDGSLIIGTAFNTEVGDGVGAVWTLGGGWVDVNTLIDSTGDGYTVVEMEKINADGWISATALRDDGSLEAVLLRIIPAPGTLMLFAGAAGLFMNGRRRRGS
ncbi:MAG: DUF3466 family protein [Phycisphaerales bacterium]